MKILAIDPGYDRCGVAVLEGDRSKPTLLFSTCLRTSSKLPFHERLAYIGNEVQTLVETHTPDLFAIEKLFFNTNQKTAMNVAEVRGMLLYIALSSKLKIEEYTPLQVKLAVVGNGRGDKKQVMAMIPKLVQLSEEKRAEKTLSDDEYDAIAIGITAFVYSHISNIADKLSPKGIAK